MRSSTVLIAIVAVVAVIAMADACRVPKMQWKATGGVPPPPTTPLPHTYLKVEDLPTDFSWGNKVYNIRSTQ
jgi:hypothetical protein